MPTHPRQQSKFRDISAAEILTMTIAAVLAIFAFCRWNSDTHQACPWCGAWDRHYFNRNKLRYRCRHCRRDFTVTSGTIFASHKKSLQQILLAAFLWAKSAKGVSAMSLSCEADWSVKAAFVTASKFREAALLTHDYSPLKGVVDIDGGYFGGKPRKPNRRRRASDSAIADRVAGRKRGLVPNPSGLSKRNWKKRQNRRVVIALCERGGPGEGAKRTITFVCEGESDREVMPLIERFTAPDAMIMSDDCPAYARVSSIREHYSVAHSREYVDSEGVHENIAESFFSRLRRREYGVHHGMRPDYLADYAQDTALLSDWKNRTLREMTLGILSKALSCPPSRSWRGYYQGNRRGGEIVMSSGDGYRWLEKGASNSAPSL